MLLRLLDDSLLMGLVAGLALGGCALLYAWLKRVERGARLREEQLRFVQLTVDQSGDLIFWVDQAGRAVYANAAACQRLGYSREELLRLSVADINPLFPTEAWKPHWDRLREQKVLRFETVHRTREGETYPVEVTAAYMAHGNTEVICSFVRDVSERKRAERALSESQERLHAIIESEPECVKLLDAQGRLLEMNPAGLRMIEADSFEQVRGQCIYPVIVERDREAFAAVTDQVFQGYAGCLQFEIEGLKGGRRWLETSAVPLYDREDKTKISALLAVTRDVTERKRAVDSLREAKLAAEATNRTKDLFLATLSHELRTPLSAILSWAQLLKSERVEASKARMGLQAIEDSARAQNQLIGDLLDISRISAGKIALEIQDTELSEVVRKAIETVRAAAEKKSLRIIEQLGSTPIFVAADAGRLEQIVWNLLSNSIKFTSPGGSIEVTAGLCDGPSVRNAQLRVEDTGKGIPAAFLPHIFEQFTQADSSSVRVHGGLGLGLALVHSLVRLQGGTVEAQSEGDGKGATFTVTLPLGSASRFAGAAYEARPSPPPAAYSAAETPSQRRKLSGVRVLFVEDEEALLDAFKARLTSLGAEVSLASSVPEALAELARATPDVIVSDIAMPGEDGYSLIRKVRARGHDKGGDTPAVALTAYADAQSRQLALLAGFQAHLAKPVDSDDLVRTILSSIGKG
ncbi:MAG TPA: PAS domain S-box protein [Polyangiales bacterium]